MNYKLHITHAAEQDLSNADYIEFTVKNPSAADKLIDIAEQKISELTLFPKAHSIIDDPVLSVWEIRCLVINNYLAFYTKKMILSMYNVFLTEKETGSVS